MSFVTYYLISCILVLLVGIVYDKFFEEMPRNDLFVLSVAIGFAALPCLNNLFTVILVWDIISKLPNLIYSKILDKVMNDIREKTEE